MLAQLKTVVLINEPIKLAFFRRVEYLEHQHLWVQLQAQNGQKQRLSSETRQPIIVLRNEGYSTVRNCQETEDLVQRCVLLPSQNSANWL